MKDVTSLRLDLAAARAIGCPVIVLRSAPSRHNAILDRLSAREREVASLVARGYSNKLIARDLRLSVATIKDHVHRALAKTRCRSRAALAALVAQANS